MRALVLSDTHFGAWTGDDLLRRPEHLERLAPQLDGLDEVIFLGDLLDLLFGRLEEGVAAAGGLLDLLRERLQGRRLVFVAGNHDHHLRLRQAENVLELRIATGRPAEELDEELRRRDFFRAFLERRLEGVEIDIRYPAYRFGEVLLTHGHYLDPHPRRAGSVGSRLLTGALWAIASGGRDDPRTVDDYEGTTTLLTELLFTIAQLPRGTAAQRGVFGVAQRIGRLAAAASAPRRASDRLRHRAGRAETVGPRPGSIRGLDGGERPSRSARLRARAGSGALPSAAPPGSCGHD
jgi:hypothetical protein